jgi:hypothetical protein
MAAARAPISRRVRALPSAQNPSGFLLERHSLEPRLDLETLGDLVIEVSDDDRGHEC